MVNLLFFTDDEPDTRQLIAALRTRGDIHFTGIVDNRDDCLRNVEEKQPDVIILPYRTRKWDGLSEMIFIRSIQVAPKVIMIANKAEKRHEERCIDMGVRDFFVMPVDEERLYQRIKQLYLQQESVSDLMPLRYSGIHLAQEYSNHAYSREATQKKIAEIFDDMRIPGHLSGYSYLMTAIILVIERPELQKSATKLLFPEIERYFGLEKGGCAERSMRYALNNAVIKGDIDYIRSYLGMWDDSNITVVRFIKGIARRLTLKY